MTTSIRQTRSLRPAEVQSGTEITQRAWCQGQIRIPVSETAGLSLQPPLVAPTPPFLKQTLVVAPVCPAQVCPWASHAP